MTRRLESTVGNSENKGGKVFPALCSVLGTLILLGVIAAFIPLTVPRLMGYEIYEVVSGSMEPEIPVGSVIYVKAAEPETIEEGDIIVFSRDGSMVTHRVQENRYVEGEFITKGDANRTDDMNPVPYDQFIGKVACSVPVAGKAAELLTSSAGKFLAGGAILGALLLQALAAFLSRRQD